MGVVTTQRGECPCGSTQAYAACCGRWHEGALALQAPTPEALMRSRYAAFALGLADYLLRTWHPRTRPDHVETGWPGLRWLGLEIRRTGIDDEGRDFVEFVARSKSQGRASRLHETSWFERVDGCWFYVDGRIHP